MGNPLGRGLLAALDIETTSVDVEDARTVEICLAIIRPGHPTDIRHALIDPGIDVPAEATAIHGYTTDRLRAEGDKPGEVLDLYLGDVALAIRAGMPLVVMNAAYDLTVLDREARRNGLPTLEERLGGPVAPVIDPMVIDKRCIRYRRRVSDTQGARCLKTLCEVYGVPWDDEQAHGAVYDALQAARVAWRMGQWSTRPVEELVGASLPLSQWPMRREDAAAFRAVGGMTLSQLHAAQAGWYAEQTESLAQFWRREANEARHRADTAVDDAARDFALQEAALLDERVDGLDGSWPLRPFVEQGVLA